MPKTRIQTRLELTALSDREFEGHGSVFGNEDLGGDVVLPGAFKRTLAQHVKSGRLPPMFWMHDPGRVAGKWLDMYEDDDGLHVKGVLAPTPLGDEIRTLLKMDAVSGLSIGYSTLDADYDDDGRRLLKEVELWEVSVVSLPMNPLAQVTHAKSRLSERGEYVPTRREFERTLRDVGCSQQVAKTIITKVYEGQPETRDVDSGARDVSEPAEPESDVAKAAQEVAELMLAAAIKQPKL
jgi:hypothetical protein